MTLDTMTIDKMTLDKMTLGKMTLGKMTLDTMTIDKMTRSHFIFVSKSIFQKSEVLKMAFTTILLTIILRSSPDHSRLRRVS